MLRTRVIPCLDVRDGRVVKGVNFVALRDAGDPVEQARAYDTAGADELMFLDITASHERRDAILEVIERTADVCFMPLGVGGGVRGVEDARRLLRAGADKIAINTAAIDDPNLLRVCADAFGSQCVVAAIDAKAVARVDGAPAWEVFTYGGRRATGLDAVACAIRAVAHGAGEILLTSMDRDGVRSGYDTALLRAVTSAVPVPVIASGGAGAAEHLVDAVRDGGADAVLAASIFHFGDVSIGDAKQAMAMAGVPVRAVPHAGRRGGLMEALLEALAALQAMIAARRGADPNASYTAQLLGDPQRAAKKLGEEAVETVIAAATLDLTALAAESADLFYHHLVLLAACGVTPEAVAERLTLRGGVSGLAEKAARPLANALKRDA